jgi:hypothetical protein
MGELKEQAEKENARVGYQVAMNLWTFQGQINWNRFNVMLVANSVIVAVIGSMLSGGNPLPSLIISLAVLGFVLCIVWVLLTARGFGYLSYWFLCAVELEKQLGGDVKIFSRFPSLRAGREVAFNGDRKGNDDGKVMTYRLGTWSRVSQKAGAYFIIAVFAISYIAFAVFGILRI